MIFVVRHAERSDQAYDRTGLNIELKHDPPITELGKLQARKAGTTIQSLVQEGQEKGQIKSSNPQYVIVSSPFLRCLQTAYHLAETFGADAVYENTIFYEDGICEFLGENIFTETVLENLFIRQKSDEEIQKYVPYKIREGFIQEKQHTVSPKYPENAPRGYDRMHECYTKLLEHFMEKLNPNVDKVLIIVTHAFGVSSVLSIHNPFWFNDTGTEYTTFNQIIYDPEARGKGKVLLKLYSKHIWDVVITPKL